MRDAYTFPAVVQRHHHQCSVPVSFGCLHEPEGVHGAPLPVDHVIHARRIIREGIGWAFCSTHDSAALCRCELSPRT